MKKKRKSSITKYAVVVFVASIFWKYIRLALGLCLWYDWYISRVYDEEQ